MSSAPDEAHATARTLAELGWLLMVFVLGYVALARGGLEAGAARAILGGSFVLGSVLVALQTLAPPPGRTTWPMLARCLTMTAYVTWVIVHAGAHRWPLASLYGVVVVATAMALGSRSTLLVLALIAVALAWLAPAHGVTADAWAGSGSILAPLALIAYASARFATDIRGAIERIRFISETDELTHLYNLRAFMHVAEPIHRQAKRYGRPYAIVMADSDNLKAVNDAHGHQTGNALLKRTAVCIRRALRDTDVAARFGGDEFILLLPETSAQGARELSDRIRRSLADKGMAVHGLHVDTSVSLGVAAFPEHGADLRTVVNKADQAMYLSKKAGRNRVTVFGTG